MKHRGWVLDLYHRNGQMIVWLKQPDGSCVRLADPWKPRLHVCGQPGDLLSLAAKQHMAGSRLVEKFEKPGDGERSRTLEVQTSSDTEAVELARTIQKNNPRLRLYNVDIPSVQMYLYEKDLFPLAFVEAEETVDGVRWTLRDSRELIEYPLPPLRKARLEIATESQGKLQGFEDRLESARITVNGETILIDSGGEEEKIQHLARTVREQDPDIVLTERGDSFIFPFLARRAQKHGILNDLVLGREPSPLRVYEVQGHSYFSYGKILYHETTARLPGRLHIDNTNAYITNDCGLQGLFEVSRTCIIPLQRASHATIGTSMTSLQLYTAVKLDVLVPWNKNESEEWKHETGLVMADRGGFIYQPRPGLHDQIGELDFSSLYPSIMMRKNLSGETVKCKCCTSTRNVPELGYNVCQKWLGIVPRSLEVLLRKRAQYKKAKREAETPAMREIFDQRQGALKWILVCAFGYLGFKNARFGRTDAHIATCAHSRSVLRKATEIAESNGFQVFHGIVDSMWLKKPDATSEGYQELCEKIARETQLPISFEGRYKWIVFLSSRIDPRVPVQNRYYGIFEDGTLKVRGIELRRHDTPPIVEECQADMLGVLSRAENAKQFLDLVPEAIGVLKSYVKNVRDGQVPLNNLVIEKNLSMNPDEYTHNVPQAIAARRLVREGGHVHAGQRVRYILTPCDAETLEDGALPIQLIDENTRYDEKMYAELLLSSAKTLLQPLGYNTEALRTSADS